MIYTIRCKKGHCPARFQTDDRDPMEGPSTSANNIESKAREHGWVEIDRGWLCPFDAPNPAAEKPIPKTLSEATPGEDYTICSFQDCCNANLTTTEGVLLKDGWRRALRAATEPAFWLCPACWKTTQPETEPGPDPIKELEDLEREAAERRQEMRKVAKEEIRAAFARILNKSERGGKARCDALATMIEDEAAVPF